MNNDDPTARFSDRVDHYVKHRPGYPEALLAALRDEVGVSAASVVADVGSGTGISTALLLRSGCEVYAIEPNAAMRQAAEAVFAGEPRFHSVAARAEETGLPDASVDVIAAGQAFHWFDRDATRREFRRILRTDAAGVPGRVALFWNTRRDDGSAFLRGYEQLLLDFGTDYTKVDHRHVDDDALRPFFGGTFETRVFPNEQVLDYAGLEGRLLSSSYVPAPGHPNHAPMLAALRRLFDAEQEDGRVRVAYDTELFFGPLRTDA